MNRKPSRPFVYLALVMVFVLVIGLVVVGVLVANRDTSMFQDVTRVLPIAINQTTAYKALQTETARAAIYYTADMSPTALPQEFNRTPTPPYDPELYARRQSEARGLITSGGPTQYAIFYATETELVRAYQTAQNFTATPTPSLTLTPSPTALATLTAPAYRGCGWMWARQDLPDVTVRAQTALDDAGIKDTTVRAEAFGENCTDAASNRVNYFAAMTTDYYLEVAVDDLADEDALGNFIGAAYTVLLALPAAELPALPGYIEITFTSAGEKRHVRMMFDEVEAALADGLAGRALYAAVGGR